MSNMCASHLLIKHSGSRNPVSSRTNESTNKTISHANTFQNWDELK
jgi:hypothetical protein